MPITTKELRRSIEGAAPVRTIVFEPLSLQEVNEVDEATWRNTAKTREYSTPKLVRESLMHFGRDVILVEHVKHSTKGIGLWRIDV